MLFEELFCGKWSECSWPAKGNSPPMGSWPCCRGVPAAVVTMTPSWSTDVVLVMAAWLVPAMAIDDDGPEPPGMGKAGILTGCCCLLGHTSRGTQHQAQPHQPRDTHALGKGAGESTLECFRNRSGSAMSCSGCSVPRPIRDYGIGRLYFP